MNELMMKLIRELVDEGVEVTLRRHSQGICADLNPQTKSGMYLFGESGTGLVECRGRYGENDVVSEVSDLVWIFADRYRGRGFGSEAWLNLAVRHGALTRKTETMVTYE